MSCDPLALTLYHWGTEAQDRLLVGCLGPAVDGLVSQGALRRFWFDRYDARGPHLFCVLLPHAGREDEVRRVLGTRLDAYLARHPSTEALSRETLEHRHAECRGGVQGEADSLPGLADNNSYLVRAHPAGGYPFGLSRHLPGHEEIWDLAGELSRWAIRRLGSERYRPTREAIRFAAALDRELERSGVDPLAYWQFHAGTLVPGLADRLDSRDPGLTDALPSLLGEANLRTFARLWHGLEPAPQTWEPLPRLLELTLFRGSDPSADVSWRVQREIDHALLKQLSLPVEQHVPLALFAFWRRVRRVESDR